MCSSPITAVTFRVDTTVSSGGSCWEYIISRTATLFPLRAWRGCYKVLSCIYSAVVPTPMQPLHPDYLITDTFTELCPQFLPVESFLSGVGLRRWTKFTWVNSQTGGIPQLFDTQLHESTANLQHMTIIISVCMCVRENYAGFLLIEKFEILLGRTSLVGYDQN